MTPNEFVAMTKKLKELGATRITAGADGSFDVHFAGAARLVPVTAPEAVAPQREPRIRNPEEAPTNAEGRKAWRNDVTQALTGGS